ncbi:MAG: hypothetical protein M3033_15640 [Acidobacteriota bacterium]|nr:hypothetical protein [Acidobacteriota bacterium]
MIFRFKNKEYRGATAVEIVNQMACESPDFAAKNVNTFQEFLEWSLKEMSDCLPPRELALSERVSDEVQAQGYLSLRHDFGIGELIK